MRDLDLAISYMSNRKVLPGNEVTDAVLCEAAEGLLAFLYPLRCVGLWEKSSMFKHVIGNVAARPVPAKKQEIDASSGSYR